MASLAKVAPKTVQGNVAQATVHELRELRQKVQNLRRYGLKKADIQTEVSEAFDQTAL